MDTGKKKIQIFIVSQQVLFRQGVELSLSSNEDIKLIGAADYSNGLPSTFDDIPPDVVILDIDISTDDGLALARKMKQHLPSIGMIIATSTPSDTQLFQALKAQAAAYLSKEVTPDQLVETVRRVSKGEHPINESLTTRPKVAEHVLHQFQELSWRSEAEAVISPLTPRETEILQYIARGYLNKQIAAELDISEQTIKNHVTSILRKLNANARTEAVVLALKHGILSLD